MKKYYVLDTNILLQNPNAIFGFEDNVVVITGTTLQELDSKKNMEGELGFNARLAARLLENIVNFRRGSRCPKIAFLQSKFPKNGSLFINYCDIFEKIV